MKEVISERKFLRLALVKEVSCSSSKRMQSAEAQAVQSAQNRLIHQFPITFSS